jgi:hypothetical protein
MKKLIICALIVCSLLFIPVFVKADTASDIATVKAELIQMLKELIAQLQQKINDILEEQANQLSTIQKQNTIIQEQSETIQLQGSAIETINQENQTMVEEIYKGKPIFNALFLREKLQNKFLSGIVDISIDQNDISNPNNNIKEVRYAIDGNIIDTQLDTTKYPNENYSLCITLFPKYGNISGGFCFSINIKN